MIYICIIHYIASNLEESHHLTLTTDLIQTLPRQHCLQTKDSKNTCAQKNLLVCEKVLPQNVAKFNYYFPLMKRPIIIIISSLGNITQNFNQHTTFSSSLQITINQRNTRQCFKRELITRHCFNDNGGIYQQYEGFTSNQNAASSLLIEAGPIVPQKEYIFLRLDGLERQQLARDKAMNEKPL